MNKYLYILLFIFIDLGQSAPFFDSKKAFNYLINQCEIGTRFPGSSEHLEMKNYLINFLTDKVDSLTIDEHLIKHPYKDIPINLYNIVGHYNLQSKNRILLMAHWDTREIADKDPDENNFDKPIIGANDGASGIAVLMVLAEILKSNPLNNIGIDLLFVDGEDMGRKGDIENFSIGTKLFSKSIKNIDNYKLSICLDMVADKDPKFKIEYFSYIQAEKAVKEIWKLANDLGYTEFVYDMERPIYDDHRALFVETGIPSIDIIDFDYPYWHTLEDTPDKCSASTLGIVGNVVVEYIYRLDN